MPRNKQAAEVCPTTGCFGAAHYAAPGRGHTEGCRHPFPTLVDLSRIHEGKCPGCREMKFIGHGPLCSDCLATAVLTHPQPPSTKPPKDPTDD